MTVLSRNTYDLAHGIDYRPDIDGLRAVAVIGVVVFHAFPKWLPGGFAGVDVFFVISGYLITAIISRDIAYGRFSPIDFYVRRIRRIFPALAVVLALVLLLGWFILVAEEYGRLGLETAYGAGFLANFHYFSSVGYFDTGVDSKLLLHLWSLGIEEQYYLVWPLILLGLYRFSNLNWVSVGILTVASFILNMWFTKTDPALAFYMPVSRAWELLAGATLALVMSTQRYHNAGMRQRGSKVPSVLCGGGLVLIAASFASLDETLAFPGWWAVPPVAGAAGVIASGSLNPVSRYLFSTPPMVGIGLISYPLYLWHWPLLSFARTVAADDITRGARIALIALAILLAYGTYKFVELPVRKAGNMRRTSKVLGGVIAAVFSLGLMTHLFGGFPKRWADSYSSGVAAMERAITKWEGDVTSCAEELSLDKAECLSKTPVSESDAVLLGDSHAGALFPGLHEEMANANLALARLGGPGCPYLIDMERDGKCGNDPGKIVDFITRSQRVKDVLIAVRWPIYATGEGFGSAEARKQIGSITSVSADAGPKPDDILRHGLIATIKILHAAGKAVTIVHSWPELGIELKKCIDRPFRAGKIQCDITRSEYVRRTEKYRSMFRQIHELYPDVHFFDPEKIFCDDEYCYGSRDGEFLYRDDDHVSLYGSRLIAKTFMADFPGFGRQ